MASAPAGTGHLERTAAEPRDKSLNTVIVKQIDEINESIRLFRLEVPKDVPVIRFLPGQWLDLFPPSISKPGGFTLTSTPAQAASFVADSPPGYLELAVRKSPDNPAAAWLWQDPSSSILSSEIRVRVGGSFVWPPPAINVRSLRKVIFVAGGLGVNPLVSMLGAIAEKGDAHTHLEVKFLYSMKDPGGERETDKMLFLDRIANIFASEKVKGELKLFLTGGEEEKGVVSCNEVDVPFWGRRMNEGDVEAAVGEADKRFSVVYVCGVPDMTDGFVTRLTATEKGMGMGMETRRVLCEKWW
ncbi:uncharacterized protein BCR38DRAFT_417896 [Pseudomassariella vexata]|uniref:FAD-binding FR-type domain-containing protein n=1 Tax=Pseudomassariella vexata TaxID=1141098 RepID=A0A1Y2EJR6_9PEZI|nr:uncharacterized protein BCR38DRAFT_417896 [Pseudomassariella vexata]ORY71747.1 hypothetical protein BCR38DRAFT_417896 [Pseudomassariella vexata]